MPKSFVDLEKHWGTVGCLILEIGKNEEDHLTSFNSS